MPVTIVQVSTQTVPEIIEAVGQTEGSKDVEVRSRVSGILEKTLYREGERVHEQTQAREVFDVSGAGDTVIATLAVMLACGADIAEAVRVANRAAGIVVAKLGTAVVTKEELFG